MFRVSLTSIFSVLALAANAQSFDDALVDRHFYDTMPGRQVIVQSYTASPIMQRDEVVMEFCRSAPSAFSTMILSQRLTPQEAEICQYDRGGELIELLGHGFAFVYIDPEGDPETIVDHYRTWSDPQLPQSDWELYDFLKQRSTPLQDLLKTNTPETCSTQSYQLACADGTFCCKGTCIENGKACN